MESVTHRQLRTRLALGSGDGEVLTSDHPKRAARLWGTGERLRQAIGCRPGPATRVTHERAVAAARTQLDAATFAAAWATGRELTLEQAIAEALDR